MQEGIIAGIPAIEVYDWTIGEVRAQVIASIERKRRENRDLAVIATGESIMIASRFGGKESTIPEIWDVFPFWSDDEIREAKLAKYKALMNKYVAAGGVRSG